MILAIILIALLGFFVGLEIYGLIKDIRKKKALKNEESKNEDN